MQLIAEPGTTPAAGRVRLALERWTLREQVVVPPTKEWPAALRWTARGGYLLLFVQLLAMCWWSQDQISHFAATLDFANIEQAVSQISHGVLDPRTTIGGWNSAAVGGTASFGHQLYFWQDHSEFIFWPLSLFQLIWPHPVTIKWLQDVAVFGAQMIAFRWITELAATTLSLRAGRAAATVVAAGAVLLAANPGFVVGNSFDVHTEAFAALAAVGSARALYYGHRTVWLWLIVGLACGDVGASYQAAIGLGSVVLGRRWLRTGLLMAAAAVGWDLLLSRIDGTTGTRVWVVYANLMNPIAQLNPQSLPDVWTLLSNIAQHPGRLLSTLSSNRHAAWENISPSGIFGWLWLPVLIPAVLVLGEAQLSGVWDIYEPGFQSIAAYALVPVGTAAILLWALRWRHQTVRRLVVLVAAALACNTLVWAFTTLPRETHRWLVPDSAATALREVSAKIKPDDEVLASQGISGDFGARASVYPFLFGPGMTVPVQEHRIWVILAPSAGIEPVPTAQTDGDIEALLEDPDARLEVHRAGVWSFLVTPPRGTQWFSFAPPDNGQAPAWLLVGPAGKSVRVGALATWHAASTAKRGFVESGAEWSYGPGNYIASFRVSAAGGVKLQVRDATARTVVGHLDAATGSHVRTLQVPFTIGGTRTDKVELKVLAQNARSTAEVYDLNVLPA